MKKQNDTKKLTLRIGGGACIEVYEDGENGKENYCWAYNSVNNAVKISEYNGKERVMTNREDKIYSVYVYAPDEKHAVKKAQDMIAKYKAEQAGL